MGLERRSYLIRINTNPRVRLWTGFGLLQTPGDAIDPEGATWNGFGVIAIPGLKTLINGVADRVEFKLSGVDSQIVAIATEEADDVFHREVRVGTVEFDADWQMVGGVTWEWAGLADRIQVESQDEKGERTRAISLSVGSADVKRGNRIFAYWTDASQRRRSASDAFCDHVALISQQVTRKFGPK